MGESLGVAAARGMLTGFGAAAGGGEGSVSGAADSEYDLLGMDCDGGLRLVAGFELAAG